MKITFDPDQVGMALDYFPDKESWQKFAHDFRPNRGYYNPQPRDMYPRKFPCVMLSDPGKIIYVNNGNDEYWNLFLYPEECDVDYS